ncbi:MAG: hypothetical protein K0R26_1516 [Bacteroidota bacterium]|jgi:predicted DNA-binding protein (MmcQ/YjbR family)|nr:hypothetical protein [Bacteroidota bacterium]
MTIEDLQSICKNLKGVTEDIKWGDHLCFNIGGKMFLVTTPDTVPHSASFKVSDNDFEELIQQPGFIPAPYLARYKWVHVDDINRISKKQWSYYAEESYHLIASKLSSTIRKQIGFRVSQ